MIARRFAAPSRQRHHLARRDGEREAVQHVGAAAVAARHVLEDDLAAHGAEGDGLRGILDLDRFVEQLVHALRGTRGRRRVPCRVPSDPGPGR